MAVGGRLETSRHPPVSERRRLTSGRLGVAVAAMSPTHGRASLSLCRYDLVLELLDFWCHPTQQHGFKGLDSRALELGPPNCQDPTILDCQVAIPHLPGTSSTTPTRASHEYTSQFANFACALHLFGDHVATLSWVSRAGYFLPSRVTLTPHPI